MTMHRERPAAARTTGNSWIWWIVGLIVAALVIWAIVAATTEDRSAPPNLAATVSDIGDNPSEYYGKTVTVSGEVNNTIGERAFTIGGQEFFGGDELLVVGARDLPALIGETYDEPLGTDDIVQVTGTVRPFNLAEFEREIGFDLDDNAFADWGNKPAIVARDLDLTPRVGAAREPAAVGAPGTPATGDAREAQNVPVSLANIVDNPEEFYGQRMTVSGTVANVISPTAFTISPATAAGEEILVAGAAAAVPSVTLGSTVQVTGTLQEFNLAEFERELGVDWEDDLFANWGDRPAILARSVSMTGAAGQGGAAR